MRYTITNKHINYYVEHGFIEFEEIIEHNLLKEAKEKLSVVTNMASSMDIYKTGRDLFRKNNLFAKIARNNNLAQIAKTLTKSKKLQLAFDQIYVTCQIFKPKGALEEYFSFQNLACIAIIRLDSTTLEYADYFQAPLQFSNVVFVDPKKEIDLSSFQATDQCLFFIGYGASRTVYSHNSNDLNNSHLKHFGYSFGDLLKTEHHPVVS